MGLHKKALRIKSEKIREALEKNGISINKMAEELGITDRNLRRSLNEKRELQPDQIEYISERTKTDPEDFIDPYITLTADKDIYRHGKLALKKGDSIKIPVIGSDNYSKADLKEWNNTMNACLHILSIGERLHSMTKEEREDYCSFIQSWIIFANKYYGSLTREQEFNLLDTCEGIADKWIEKNSQK